MLKNVMVYLVGFSGTGKLTVARELALILKARVVDNQWINNPIFGLLDNDRVTPFPIGVWDQITKVRQAVLDTIATLSAPDANFILTHAGYDNDREDWEIYNAIARTAERRGGYLCSSQAFMRGSRAGEASGLAGKGFEIQKHGPGGGPSRGEDARCSEGQPCQPNDIGRIGYQSAGKCPPHP
jgi:hypothetical protein